MKRLNIVSGFVPPSVLDRTMKLPESMIPVRKSGRTARKI